MEFDTQASLHVSTFQQTMSFTLMYEGATANSPTKSFNGLDWKRSSSTLNTVYRESTSSPKAVCINFCAHVLHELRLLA